MNKEHRLLDLLFEKLYQNLFESDSKEHLKVKMNFSKGINGENLMIHITDEKNNKNLFVDMDSYTKTVALNCSDSDFLNINSILPDKISIDSYNNFDTWIEKFKEKYDKYKDVYDNVDTILKSFDIDIKTELRDGNLNDLIND